MIMCKDCLCNMKVTNTVNDKFFGEVIRRRSCPKCGNVYFTVEKQIKQEKETGLQKFLKSYMGE